MNKELDIRLNNSQNNISPAISCNLENGYLIEASAGTGKTWTLTGILLRLLVEKKYPPEKIIATTFTRLAAAEMQERLQKRLNNFCKYLIWMQSKKEKYPNWFSLGVDENISIDDVLNEIKDIASKEEIEEYDDAINLHLIKFLLTDSQNHILELTIRRISLLLSTLDKLFIGTIDSLAQKWLKEFSSEISYNTETKIIDDYSDIIHSLIHDELRKSRYTLSQESPELYQIIDKSIFSDTSSIVKLIKLSLDFYTANIDKVEKVNDFYFKWINDFIQDFLNQDLSVFNPYYDTNYCTETCGFKKGIISNNFYLLESIIQKIYDYKIGFIKFITKEEKNLIEKLDEIDSDKLFKKGYEKSRDEFHKLPILYLKKLNKLLKDIKSVRDKYKIYLYSEIAKTVKVEMKNYLEKKNQSTFTFQMVRLNEALEDNKELTRYIRFLYPVALIDESQDISDLQFNLIKLIYLQDLKEQRDKEKKRTKPGFLLLVGDPKQAIYRFRGGDVANYNQAKYYGKNPNQLNHLPILDSSLTLNVNHRSNSEMIKALNNWFYDNQKTNNENHARLGDDIFYQEILAKKDLKILSWQNHLTNKTIPDYLTDKTINILFYDNDDVNVFSSVAKHINSILNMDGFIDVDGIKRRIVPNDIAILSRNHDNLIKIKHHLQEWNIHSVLPKSINIFSTQAAKDLHKLLLAVMDNSNKNKISLLLTSSFFNLDLNEANNTILSNDFYYNKFVTYLKKAKYNFNRFGIASLLNYCLLNNPLSGNLNNQENTLWKQIAKYNERYIADLWQLIELMSNKQALRNVHELHFMSWFEKMLKSKNEEEAYKQLPLPSEVGINLMTIHRSKGLEFPIVYIFGLDDSIINNKQLFYTYIHKEDYTIQRCISANERYIEKNRHEDIDELRRLSYVALTRASEQTFIIANQNIKKNKMDGCPLYSWLESNQQEQLNIPSRLTSQIGQIHLNKCQDFISEIYQNKKTNQEKITYHHWKNIFTKDIFSGTVNTSASALINQLKISDDENEVIEYIKKNKNIENTNIAYKPNDIRLNFEKGKYVGTFLHKLLQEINIHNKDDISNKISQYIKKQNIAKEYDKDYQENHQQLIEWLIQIYHTPMKSSNISIYDVDERKCIKEMSFLLGINDNFSIQKLNCILNNSGKNIFINDENSDFIYKYLKGEIDLVYEYQGKFYIVDYKSNFVSEYLSDYHHKNLSYIMNTQGYWLQACIYQLALHKLLKLRIKDYQGNEKKYLGAIEFVFLRGVDKEFHDSGRINWDVPIDLIYQLDGLFVSKK